MFWSSKKKIESLEKKVASLEQRVHNEVWGNFQLRFTVKKDLENLCRDMRSEQRATQKELNALLKMLNLQAVEQPASIRLVKVSNDREEI